MALLGLNIKQEDWTPTEASTDMANVSHLVPSFHGAFPIPTTPDVTAHNPKFAACAGTKEAHASALNCAKGMAMMAVRVLTDDGVADGARRDFEKKDPESIERSL
jgi:metal-dependent amidase/aminoacylase/carboxypeptidase family protein